MNGGGETESMYALNEWQTPGLKSESDVCHCMSESVLRPVNWLRGTAGEDCHLLHTHACELFL